MIQSFKESITRAESEKNQPFGKYVLPYAHFQLALTEKKGSVRSLLKVSMPPNRRNWLNWIVEICSDQILMKINKVSTRTKQEKIFYLIEIILK